MFSTENILLTFPVWFDDATDSRRREKKDTCRLLLHKIASFLPDVWSGDDDDDDDEAGCRLD